MRAIPRQIDVKYLRDWVRESSRSNLDLFDAWRIIGRFYCTSLVMRSACPVECMRCRQNIVAMMRKSNQANVPPAYLTVLAKAYAAEMNEKAAEERHLPPKGSSLFETNPFEDILKDLP